MANDKKKEEMRSRNAERWRQAKNNHQGLRCTIEFYVPIPREHRMKPMEGKEKLVEILNPKIDALRKTVKTHDGIFHTYQHV